MEQQYKGIAYPVEKTAYGLLASGDNLSQVKASMLAIIMTNPGERVMRPNFGTPLYKLKIRPRELIENEAKYMIALALRKFEKRAQIQDIRTTLMPNGSLNVVVYFFEPTTSLQDVQQLTLQLQLLDN